MVDVVGRTVRILEFDQMLDRPKDIVIGQRPVVQRKVEIHPGVELVPADHGQVVVIRVTEQIFEKISRNFRSGRRAGAQPFVNIDLGAFQVLTLVKLQGIANGG